MYYRPLAVWPPSAHPNKLTSLCPYPFLCIPQLSLPAAISGIYTPLSLSFTVSASIHSQQFHALQAVATTPFYLTFSLAL
jgi:hypothetical protein